MQKNKMLYFVLLFMWNLLIQNGNSRHVSSVFTDSQVTNATDLNTMVIRQTESGTPKTVASDRTDAESTLTAESTNTSTVETMTDIKLKPITGTMRKEANMTLPTLESKTEEENTHLASNNTITVVSKTMTTEKSRPPNTKEIYNGTKMIELTNLPVSSNEPDQTPDTPSSDYIPTTVPTQLPSSPKSKISWTSNTMKTMQKSHMVTTPKSEMTPGRFSLLPITKKSVINPYSPAEHNFIHNAAKIAIICIGVFLFVMFVIVVWRIRYLHMQQSNKEDYMYLLPIKDY